MVNIYFILTIALLGERKIGPGVCDGQIGLADGFVLGVPVAASRFEWVQDRLTVFMTVHPVLSEMAAQAQEPTREPSEASLNFIINLQGIFRHLRCISLPFRPWKDLQGIPGGRKNTDILRKWRICHASICVLTPRYVLNK